MPRSAWYFDYDGAMKLSIVALVALVSLSAAGLAAVVQSTTQVRHIVVFKYKPTATPEQIAQVTTAFAALKDKIPGIVSFERGVNNSPENRNNGFTHVYQVTFTDAKARDAYLPHPDHQAFGTLLGTLGIVDDVFVVDYVPE